MKERLNAKNFVEQARRVHGNKYNYDKTIYVKAKEKVIITCPIHGDFEQRPQDHVLKGCGCQKCKAQRTIETHSYNFDTFLKLAKEKHGDKYKYDENSYVKYSSKIKIICPIHGEFWQMPRDHITTSCGCPKCGRLQANESEKYTLNEFVDKANKIHFNKYDYSKVKYINSNTKITIICPEHGEFEQRPANHLSGQGCPKCRLVGQTRLFNKLKQTFPNEEIIWEATNKIIPWIGNQRIDIYFPKINLAVELMGQQHYEKIPYFKNGASLEITRQRDELKRKKCKENNCILIEIKYNYTQTDYNNLAKLITQKLEDLYERYYNESTKQKDKDEFALEAGQLLVQEILYNTQDNSGIINKLS